MKAILRRALALILAAALLCPTVLASDALGSPIYSYTLDICDDTTLTRQVMWSASRQDLRTENYVVYTPSSSVSPQVSFGSSVLARQSVLSMARELESEGGRVLSGINGDYFVLATGDPLGLVVTDGILRSSASYLNALGFFPDGSALIGKPELDLRANFLGYSLKLADINKIRTTSGYYLFTDDFGATTRNTAPGVDVILSPIPGPEGQPVTGADGIALTTSNRLRIGSLVSCRVEQVVDATGATAIPDGKFILSISNGANQWLQDMARSLRPGDQLDLQISSPDPRWSQVDSAVGALYWILTDGQVVSGISDGAAAPRTAVGIRPDGSVIFYTIDGRQSGHSVGATIQMAAERLRELGCREAVLLDGGGSTTLVSTYPDYGSSSVVNKPSEGTPRSVSNAIFLVSNLSPTGRAASLYVTPSSLTLLSGASTRCAVTPMDSGWYPMDALPGQVTWSSPEGAVDQTGLFTAPARTGTYTVTASSGGVSGSTRIQVYDTPDAITLKDQATGKTVSSLALSAGQETDLTAAAFYRTVALTCTDRCFTWSADPAIGTISADGRFTAGQNSASGTIRVTAGGHTASLPVTVTAPPAVTLLADFEGTDPWFRTSQARLTPDDDQVRLGRQSLRVDYTLYNNSAQLTARHPLEEDHRWLALWVRSDQSGPALSASFRTGDGRETGVPLLTLSKGDWTYAAAAIPEDAEAFTGLTLSGRGSAGTIWLDQVTLSSQKDRDTTPPALSLSVSGSTLTARIADNDRNPLTADRLTLTADGDPIPFTWQAGTLTARLSGLGTGLHRVTVTAADPSGNLARSSVTLGSAAGRNPFGDMTGHWAADYTGRLYELGIITGIPSGDALLFAPDRSITRGDFALMAVRWLGLDPEDYRGVSLPCADAHTIPAWNLNAVKALWDLGIMTGSKGSDGSLYANARDSITRAEAMTILGRMEARGFAPADLSQFRDAASVPSWARDHVAVLVAQGVVSGSGGALRPQAPVTRAEVAKMLFTLW